MNHHRNASTGSSCTYGSSGSSSKGPQNSKTARLAQSTPQSFRPNRLQQPRQARNPTASNSHNQVQTKSQTGSTMNQQHNNPTPQCHTTISNNNNSNSNHNRPPLNVYTRGSIGAVKNITASATPSAMTAAVISTTSSNSAAVASLNTAASPMKQQQLTVQSSSRQGSSATPISEQSSSSFLLQQQQIVNCRAHAKLAKRVMEGNVTFIQCSSCVKRFSLSP